MAKEIKEPNASVEQALEFMSKLAQAMKITSRSASGVQWMIDNMYQIGPYAEYFIETSGLRDPSLITQVKEGWETNRQLHRTYDKCGQNQYLLDLKSRNMLKGNALGNIAGTDQVRQNFWMFLGEPLHAAIFPREQLVREFAMRGFYPAQPAEVVILLDSLRGSKKAQHPFVSLAYHQDPIVAYLEDFKDDAPIIVQRVGWVSTPFEVLQRNWSFVGATMKR